MKEEKGRAGEEEVYEMSSSMRSWGKMEKRKRWSSGRNGKRNMRKGNKKSAVKEKEGKEGGKEKVNEEDENLIKIKRNTVKGRAGQKEMGEKDQKKNSE